MDRLRTGAALRRICGWQRKREAPSESVFSRAFAEAPGHAVVQRVHEALLCPTHRDWLAGQLRGDSTAIEAREKPAAKQKAPARPRDERVQRRGHRAAGVSAARPLERVGVAHAAVDAPQVLECGGGRPARCVRCSDRRGARCRAVAQGADRSMRGQGDPARTIRPHAARKNVGRRPQFSCGVRRGGVPRRIAAGAIPEPAIRTAAAGARIPAQPPCRLLVGVRRQRPALVMRHRRPGSLSTVQLAATRPGRGLRSHRLPVGENWAMPAAASQWPPSRILVRYADSHVLEGGHR